MSYRIIIPIKIIFSNICFECLIINIYRLSNNRLKINYIHIYNLIRLYCRTNNNFNCVSCFRVQLLILIFNCFICSNIAISQYHMQYIDLFHLISKYFHFFYSNYIFILKKNQRLLFLIS